MIANVKIYLNSEFLGHSNLDMEPNQTVDSPEVTAQADAIYGPGNWDTIEIQTSE